MKQAPDGAVVGCVVAEKLGGGAFVGGVVEIVDDIVNPHYPQQVAPRSIVVEESTSQEVTEWVGKQ